MIIFCIIFGVLSVILGLWVGAHANKISHLLCGGFTAWFGAMIVFFGFWLASSTTYYLEAEPIAYNTDTTVFSTPNGYYTANAIYDEDTVYLLTMNSMGTTNTKDDEILVVWKCDEGSVG